MARTLIKGAIIADGTGKKPYKGSVLIDGMRITGIITGEKLPEADTVIDASGKTLTPGFIDIHRHCDIKPFTDPHFGDIMLAQGITSTIVGNCGISMTPASPDAKTAEEAYDFDEPVLGPPFPAIKTYPDYLARLGKCRLPLNMGAMIGTGSVKIAVKGFSSAPYTEEEMEKARTLVREALDLGAPGISAGIMYIPECYSTTDEFAELLKPLGKSGRVLTTHIRGEGDSMVESVREVLEIAEKAGCPLEISHFKSCGMKNWRKEIHRAIALIEQARERGMDVTCDFYPYEGGSTALTTMLPPVFVAGDMKRALEKLGTAEGTEEFRKTASAEYDGWDNYCITLGWDRIIISGVTEEYKDLIGLDMVTAARQAGFEDAFALAARLMHDGNGRASIINMSMCQEDIGTVAQLPYSIVISDSIYADTGNPHPRMYGAFPKMIREYVNERHILSLEEAVHKMTELPARRMKLKDRGLVKEGCFADLNIFDPSAFRDRATFRDPAVAAEGLSYCFINGTLVFRDGEVLKRDSGQILKAED